MGAYRLMVGSLLSNLKISQGEKFRKTKGEG
jgi:hypothetical protein